MTGRAFPDPFSGEIVTSRFGGTTSASDADIVDAEFETVETFGRAGKSPRPEGSAGRIPGLDMLTAKTSRISRRGEPGGWAFWTVGLGIVAASFWVAGGHSLVLGPDAARMARVQPPLRVANFQSRIETGAGRPVLFVDGEIANDGDQPAVVPPFSIDVETVDGTTRFHMGDHEAPIAPAARLRFSGRLAAPEGKIGAVTITLGAMPAKKQKGV